MVIDDSEAKIHPSPLVVLALVPWQWCNNPPPPPTPRNLIKAEEERGGPCTSGRERVFPVVERQKIRHAGLHCYYGALCVA